ncbi:MAG: DUF4924 family protein [Bacteroidaceae bacterium]|nr:DUF4924 family protein [Bacteroidaceae bacterium]
MFISQELREKNIAEYLLYMWQMEDVIRAAGFDVDKLDDLVIKGSGRSDADKTEWREWFSNLIAMMLSEEKKISGHLQINENVLLFLSELHNRLIKSAKSEDYRDLYYKVLPFIVEFRSKNKRTDTEELRDCFDMLYGVLLLRLQNVAVSDSTNQAVAAISRLLALLSDYYRRERLGELDLED